METLLLPSPPVLRFHLLDDQGLVVFPLHDPSRSDCSHNSLTVLQVKYWKCSKQTAVWMEPNLKLPVRGTGYLYVWGKEREDKTRQNKTHHPSTVAEGTEFRKVKNVEGWGGVGLEPCISAAEWGQSGAVSQGLREKSHHVRSFFHPLCPSGSWEVGLSGLGPLTAPEQSQ